MQRGRSNDNIVALREISFDPFTVITLVILANQTHVACVR